MTNKLPQVAKKCILDDVLKYEQPAKYIVESTNYDDSYNIPVLTAGKSFIIGYTNETEGICDNLPVIIFDDFTTSSQYVDFPFKVKSSAMKILHPTEDANIKYLYYFMQTIQHKADTHKRYWISEYSQRKIELPSKPEQDKIVEKIEEEFGKIDEGVEKLKSAQEQIKQYRQSVLKSAFDGKLYKTTEWEEKTLEEITKKIGDVDHKMPKEVDSGIPYISPKDFFGINGIDLENAKKISISDYEILSKKIVPERNDIIFPRYGTIGVLRYVDTDENFLVSYSCAVIKTDNTKASSRYLYYYLLSPQIKSQIQKSIRQTTQANIGIQSIKDFKIKIGTLDEQKQIVKEIEKRFEAADEVERVIAENLDKAEQLKQSILKKAFEGRLVPQDPTDQPASELLVKIKAERGK